MALETNGTRVRLSREELAAFLDAAFPPETRPSLGELVGVDAGHIRMTLKPTPGMARPGNIVSGPSLMALADVAAYGVVVAHHGPEAGGHQLALHHLSAAGLVRTHCC